MKKPDIDLYGYIKENKKEFVIIGGTAIIWTSMVVSSRVMKQLSIQTYTASYAATADAMEQFLDGAKAIID
jgi:hypothetical protein